MMKTFKKKICTALVLIMVMSAVIIGSGDINVNAEIQPKGNCPDCNRLTVVSCLKQNVYSYTTSCGKSSSCKVKVYKSRSAEICESCGKGFVSICTQGYWPTRVWGNTEEVSKCSESVSLFGKIR